MSYASLLERVGLHVKTPSVDVEPEMDGPSRQLYDDLRDSITTAITAQRPILTHLNADTSWLLQLPYPRDAVKPAGRTRFNILVDPW